VEEEEGGTTRAFFSLQISFKVGDCLEKKGKIPPYSSSKANFVHLKPERNKSRQQEVLVFTNVFCC
jgi:hypothetical protein